MRTMERTPNTFRKLGATALLFALLLLPGCRTSIGVPTQASSTIVYAAEGVPESELAHVWVSYQITVDTIDGVATSFEAPEKCLYYRVSLLAGTRVFGLRLDYESATHKVRTDAPQELTVELAEGHSYRLIDLGAGTNQARNFQPWLQSGAPLDETIDLSRGRSDS